MVLDGSHSQSLSQLLMKCSQESGQKGVGMFSFGNKDGITDTSIFHLLHLYFSITGSVLFSFRKASKHNWTGLIKVTDAKEVTIRLMIK